MGLRQRLIDDSIREQYFIFCYHGAMKRSIVLLCSLLVLGAGCSSFVPAIPSSPTVDSGTPSPEGTIAFKQGFGLLPGVNPNIAKGQLSESPINVTWKNLPEIPPEVTVIRRRSSMPSVTVLQNLTSAMNIPIGVLESNPSVKGLAASWEDQSGYHWTYDAESDRLSFEKIKPAISLTSSVPVSADVLSQSAIQFTTERGLLSSDWGAPYAVFSWDEWWSARTKEGKCMTKATVEVIRKMAREASLDFDLLSSMALSTSGDCVDPEFPNVQVVRFSQNKDGQDVYRADGTPAIAGELSIRMDTREVVRGWAELKRESDRSNYPAIQQDRLEAYFKHGGVSGFPASAKSYAISAVQQGVYQYVGTRNGQDRIFYIPAMQAEGVLTYENGTTIPYAIVVPLTREDQFDPDERD